MPNPDEFRSVFARRGVIPFPATAVSSLPIAAEDAAWLVNVGLPRSAAPFLSFGSKSVIDIPPLAQNSATNSDGRYRVIGTNGNGDPIAIDTTSAGEIVYLKHDNSFQPVFINSTVTRLADALIAYSRLIVEARAVNRPDGLLEDEMPPESVRRFVSALATIDPPALQSGLWADELKQISRGSL